MHPPSTDPRPDRPHRPAPPTDARRTARRLAVCLGLLLAPPLLAQTGPVADAPARPWLEPPLETLGDAHRVREGQAAGPEAIAADAARAADGIVIGHVPAHDALRRAAEGTRDAEPYFVTDLDEDAWIADVGVFLRGDTDYDGFYTSFELSIDVDTSSREREVYAVIDVTEPDGRLTLSHATRTFTIRGDAVSDEYRVEVELLDNHRAAYRDVRIEVRDARDDTFLDEVSAYSFASLAGLPLESESPFDDAFAPVDDYDYGHDSSYGSAIDAEFGLGVFVSGSSSSVSASRYDSDSYVAGYAGAAGPFGLLVLALPLIGRWRRARR